MNHIYDIDSTTLLLKRVSPKEGDDNTKNFDDEEDLDEKDVEDDLDELKEEEEDEKDAFGGNEEEDEGSY